MPLQIVRRAYVFLCCYARTIFLLCFLRSINRSFFLEHCCTIFVLCPVVPCKLFWTEVLSIFIACCCHGLILGKTAQVFFPILIGLFFTVSVCFEKARLSSVFSGWSKFCIQKVGTYPPILNHTEIACSIKAWKHYVLSSSKFSIGNKMFSTLRACGAF